MVDDENAKMHFNFFFYYLITPYAKKNGYIKYYLYFNVIYNIIFPFLVVYSWQSVMYDTKSLCTVRDWTHQMNGETKLSCGL